MARIVLFMVLAVVMAVLFVDAIRPRDIVVQPIPIPTVDSAWTVPWWISHERS